MKIIGKTLEGDLIIQVSQVEWDHLQEKPDATIYEIEWDTLEEWNRQLIDGLNKLKLSKRVFGALERAAEIRTVYYPMVDGIRKETPTDPYISSYGFQNRNGQLLSFEQWCDYTLTRPNEFCIGYIGEKGKSELLQAIKQYRQQEPAVS